MAKINSYTVSGTKTSLNLPKVFQEKINMDLLAQASRVYQDRSHPGLSKVKTRSDISLSKAKIWRQKGTGRARHGARSAPIFVGGGVAHGPKGVKRTLKLPRKMINKSLFIALSLKVKKNELVSVSNLSKVNKTKDAQKFINAILNKENLKKGNISLIIRWENIQTRKAFRNISNVKVLDIESLNAQDVLFGGLLVIEKDAFDVLTKRVAADKESDGKKRITKRTKVSGATEKKRSTKSTEKTGIAKKKAAKTLKTRSKKGSK